MGLLRIGSQGSLHTDSFDLSLCRNTLDVHANIKITQQRLSQKDALSLGADEVHLKFLPANINKQLTAFHRVSVRADYNYALNLKGLNTKKKTKNEYSTISMNYVLTIKGWLRNVFPEGPSIVLELVRKTPLLRCRQGRNCWECRSFSSNSPSIQEERQVIKLSDNPAYR